MAVNNQTVEHTNTFYVQPLEPSFYTYPATTYTYVVGEDKTMRAIEIIKLLRKSKKIKLESIDSFIELIKEISELI